MSIADKLRRDAEAALKEDGMYYSGEYLSGIADSVEAVVAENTTLRKVLQASISEYASENCSNCWGGLCDDCGCWISDWEEELRELGIEVV